MDITPADLAREYTAAAARWPVIRETELDYDLPPFCLFAVGSRETNLDPVYTEGETGDDGHGHGIFQEDDRSHDIPPGFDTDIGQQAVTAARMLSGLIAAHGEQGGYDAYNSGRTVDSATTGGDYGSDVLSRRLWLVANYGDDDMGFWGKDGATTEQQVQDARLAYIRQWWLAYHHDVEFSVQTQQAALAYWGANGGDATQAAIRDGRWG